MIYYCAIIAILSALCVLYFFYQNKGRKIERYYFKHNKYLFALLTFVNFLLMISAVMNGKYIASLIFEILFKKFKKLYF